MLFLFDCFELDTDKLELRRDGAVVPIEPKVFDFLELLLSSRGRVVSKDEMIDALWQGRVISDSALSTCVRAARSVIDDSGRDQRLISTIPRRGFRFVGNVATTKTSAVRRAASSASPPIDSYEVPEDGLALPDQPSIAVLPFDDLNPSIDRFAFARGLTCDVTSLLGRSRWMFVAARGSSFQFSPHEVQEARSKLGVRYILQGSVQSAENRFRVNVALIDAVQNSEIWSEVFDRSYSDIFLVQQEVSEQISFHTVSEIELTERRLAMLQPIENLDAWSAYHIGCWHLDRHTPQDYEKALEYFNTAAKIDRYAARIYAGLSAVHRQRAFLNLSSDASDDIKRAFDLAEQALSLDPRDPQAHWAMGRALMLRHEVSPAIRAFQNGTELNPSFAISQYSMGFGQTMIGQSGPGNEAVSRAERLSPIDPMKFAMLAAQAFNAALEEDYDAAADLADLAAGHPNAHPHILAIAALCNALCGRSAQAELRAKKLTLLKSGYAVDDFFQAFPFQSEAQIKIWRRGFQLLSS